MITKNTIDGVTEYTNDEGEYHNLHRPSRYGTNGYAYYMNNKLHNIVGPVTASKWYYINNKKVLDA